MQVMLHLFLSKMLVTMTLHSGQQIQNDITLKLCENVAIKVLILARSKWQNPRFFDEICIF